MKLTKLTREQGNQLYLNRRKKKMGIATTRKRLTGKNFTTGWLTLMKAAAVLKIQPKSVMRRVQRGTMKRKTLKDGTKLFFVKAMTNTKAA